jgi:hypothetical protein
VNSCWSGGQLQQRIQFGHSSTSGTPATREYRSRALSAEIAQWPPAKLSRTERGLRHLTIEEVATLLTAWQFPGDEREQVLDEIQVGSSSGWWDRPIPGVLQKVGALASYEADAYEMISATLGFVPGLLQTYETAVGYVDRTNYCKSP